MTTELGLMCCLGCQVLLSYCCLTGGLCSGALLPHHGRRSEALQKTNSAAAAGAQAPTAAETDLQAHAPTSTLTSLPGAAVSLF